MKTKLNAGELALVSSTLFGLFFGAGNLIFPVHLGQLAGANVAWALLGFIVSAVGLPILGVVVIGATHSSGLQELSSRIDPRYAKIFTALLYLTIGPFFAIPRTATTSFTIGVEPLVNDASNKNLALLLFTAVFFAAALFFSLRPSGIMTWIGKILNPIFLVFLAILVVAALWNPTTSVANVTPDVTYQSGVFFKGLLDGYNTMDGIASLAFGIVIINVITSAGITHDRAIAKSTLKAGIFAGLLMAFIYVLITIVGVQSRGLFETSENGGIALAQISNHYLGNAGALVLALTITFACFKTAIGLVTACGQAFEPLLKGKISYNTLVIVFSVFSFLMANVGLTALIAYAIPMLMLLYPLAISLILLAFVDVYASVPRMVYVSVTIGAAFGAFFDFVKTLPWGIDVSWAGRFLPMFDLGLGWVVPAAIGAVVGAALFALSGSKRVHA
ncbi:LIVCS family branched-chain amino acid:cation transporter [Arcanobacterium pluranimalium]|uniref:branched-chain amino acid transport system II carrier protein n=1 Tax=Arcanobacterium pluranimalium TaxID=108028 RepID=UPI0019578898|nr:branched-chain amino acid transport system II carrier protein [Arcanobacterium pluranimalium]MBM7825166.1 LIVCS family branched-chain amino acid:cation transporter [Arcanobacterium pluranimalium]